jgi:hypothetical protein
MGVRPGVPKDVRPNRWGACPGPGCGQYPRAVFGDATVNLALDLASGSEITVTPENARLIVRNASDGGMVHDSGE